MEPYTKGFLGVSEGKDSACNAGDPGSILGLGKSPREEMATHCGTLAFENSMDREAWWATLDVVAMNQKGRRDFTFTFMPR